MKNSQIYTLLAGAACITCIATHEVGLLPLTICYGMISYCYEWYERRDK